ncbi:23S rRNA pseudouridine(1911/1915/1917) synthase RluD [Ferribacterium limneticum]|uniref:23S rRNA pseudouridine(1911/1915/1917) synthase RluD n=1 Tax=Ferribacterium limneticum TaxID=76259 RepID=UPI001CF94E2E|nr:23S rRNA pseudouridine(1911/1915/1917) synthase RluD [Ferribacterium limneticum]UCV18009.1 23S rRNA pseudouridine(1911/1915/1917) synthase RluD [Ferribacterium limneticum]
MNDDPVENSGDYSRTEPLHLTVPDASYGRRLDQVLAELLPQHSRNRLQGWVRDACVLVDGKAETEPKRKMMGGEKLLVSEPTDIRNQPELPEDIPLDVVYEDETLLVINKPAGLVVHPGSGNWSGTLMNALLHHVPGIEAVPRAGIVHRLDKDTSGLLVVAKTLEAQTDLVRQLQARTVRRIYLALAAGAMKHEGTVNEPIGRHPSQRIKMAIVPENRGGKPAITNIRILELFPYTTFVECSLETGRTHQIRVHMAAIHHPLVGDQVYGKHNPKLPEFPRQALHATRLGLVHPLTGLKMQWEVPMPEDMRDLLDSLRYG